MNKKSVSDNWKHKKQGDMAISSAAEYLTFQAATGENSIEVRYQNENIWLTQKMIAELYGVDRSVITKHLKSIFTDGELDEKVVCAYFAQTTTHGAIKGKTQTKNVKFYSLQAIISVGFKVDNQRAVQFRKWVGQIAKDYTIQGWVMDVPRLKGGHMFTDEYFERQLAIIREIRLSERKFYQKITDIYATAIDYDKTAKITQDFFATVQNRLHFAIHGQTAAELIVERSNADKRNMGLNTWEAAPNGKIQKPDVSVAKNYLTDKEIGELERVVSAYLDIAELQAERKMPMTMEDWDTYLMRFLTMTKQEMLSGKGRVSAKEAKLHAETQFEKYRITQDRLFESDFDRFISEQEGLNGEGRE